MTHGATLIFPAVNQAAADYIADALARGESVVAAASAFGAGNAAVGGYLHQLPSIYDTSFDAELRSLIKTHGITRVYCPVAAVHDFMSKRIAAKDFALQLIGKSPIQAQMDAHQTLMRRASELHEFSTVCAESAKSCSLLVIASLLKHATQIYGESNDDKLAALAAIFASAPEGDVVEIGSLMGRSAFVLRFLSSLFKIGPLLTVDPWKASNAIQHDSPKVFQSLVDEWDFEVLADGFVVNMLPFGIGHHAHLRMPSDVGFQMYSSGNPLQGLEGTEVSYGRKIAVLHIDGNHDFAHVAKDVELWVPCIVPGGWLVLDDYVWAHGDGPKRVGDSLLDRLAHRVQRTFVCGKALFVRITI